MGLSGAVTIGRGRFGRRKTLPLTPGARLGGYEIVSPLGAGGMGEVYRAKDPELDREVAIKVLSDASPRIPRPSSASKARRRPWRRFPIRIL
jgi:serine/threonine protein kinase